MNEGLDKTANSDHELGDDIQHAAAVLQEARQRAQRQLTVRYPVLFATWGLTFLLGYGSLWLSVRGQHPYQGPTPTALLALTIVVAAAMAVTVVIVGRAMSGIGGSSANHRRVGGLSAAAAYIGVFTLEAALDHAGASRAVLGVYGAAAPILLIGLIYAASSAFDMDWTQFGLGVWLIVVAAGGAFAGPATVWAVDALAISGAFLGVAAVRFWRRS
jgi:hypothetical protein